MKKTIALITTSIISCLLLIAIILTTFVFNNKINALNNQITKLNAELEEEQISTNEWFTYEVLEDYGLQNLARPNLKFSSSTFNNWEDQYRYVGWFEEATDEVFTNYIKDLYNEFGFKYNRDCEYKSSYTEILTYSNSSTSSNTHYHYWSSKLVGVKKNTYIFASFNISYTKCENEADNSINITFYLPKLIED